MRQWRRGRGSRSVYGSGRSGGRRLARRPRPPAFPPPDGHRAHARGRGAQQQDQLRSRPRHKRPPKRMTIIVVLKHCVIVTPSCLLFAVQIIVP